MRGSAAAFRVELSGDRGNGRALTVAMIAFAISQDCSLQVLMSSTGLLPGVSATVQRSVFLDFRPAVSTDAEVPDLGRRIEMSSSQPSGNVEAASVWVRLLGFVNTCGLIDPR